MKSKKTPAPDLNEIIPILIGIWRRFRKEGGPPDGLQTREFRGVVAAVKVLQQEFEGEQSLAGQDYFEKPELLGAYLLYNWTIHYQQGLSLIGELPSAPNRVLDICSGPAPMAFAALRHGAQDVTAIDRNIRAMELGAEACGRYGMPLTIRRWKGTKEKLPVEGLFDLIILGHCLEELFPQTEKGWREQQFMFIRSLFDRLTPTGHLLFVESSYLHANRRVLQLRDHLVKQGVPIQAPCIWRGECPALQTEKSPCFAQREMEKPFLIKELQRAAEINLSSLKMTYLLVRNPALGWPQLADKKFYRVISPPVEAFQGKRFYLCGTDGKKSLGCHLRQVPQEAKAFDYLRRGELISIENPLEKNNAMDIVQDTHVSLEAALGKPIPERNIDG
jgi:hypothetical protein